MLRRADVSGNGLQYYTHRTDFILPLMVYYCSFPFSIKVDAAVCECLFHVHRLPTADGYCQSVNLFKLYLFHLDIISGGRAKYDSFNYKSINRHYLLGSMRTISSNILYRSIFHSNSFNDCRRSSLGTTFVEKQIEVISFAGCGHTESLNAALLKMDHPFFDSCHFPVYVF